MNEWVYFCIGSISTIIIEVLIILLVLFFPRRSRKRAESRDFAELESYSYKDSINDYWEEDDRLGNERLSGDISTPAPPPPKKD